MSTSVEYRRLVRRVNELKRTFLPPVSPTGTYTDPEYDRVRAFRLLSHAEIEAYLEAICIRTVVAVESAWQADSVTRTAVLGLVAFSEGVAGLPPEALPTGRSMIRGRVEEAKNRYTTYAKVDNMGIKEKQVLRLLLPLGIREHEIGSTLTADLNTFGVQRGDHAHQAAAAQVPPDPSDTRTLLALRI